MADYNILTMYIHIEQMDRLITIPGKGKISVDFLNETNCAAHTSVAVSIPKKTIKKFKSSKTSFRLFL